MGNGKINGMEVKIDTAGRIVVPKPIRQRLGLQAGTDLEITEGPRTILLRRTDRKPALVREGHLLVQTGKLPDGHDLVKTVEQDRDARIQEIWSR